MLPKPTYILCLTFRTLRISSSGWSIKPNCLHLPGNKETLLIIQGENVMQCSGRNWFFSRAISAYIFAIYTFYPSSLSIWFFLHWDYKKSPSQKKKLTNILFSTSMKVLWGFWIMKRILTHLLPYSSVKTVLWVLATYLENWIWTPQFIFAFSKTFSNCLWVNFKKLQCTFVM